MFIFNKYHKSNLYFGQVHSMIYFLYDLQNNTGLNVIFNAQDNVTNIKELFYFINFNKYNNCF